MGCVFVSVGSKNEFSVARSIAYIEMFRIYLHHISIRLFRQYYFARNFSACC